MKTVDEILERALGHDNTIWRDKRLAQAKSELRELFTGMAVLKLKGEDGELWLRFSDILSLLEGK